MTSPVSACLIVRTDPQIQIAVSSLRPHVREICVVYTGYPDEVDYDRVLDLQRAGLIDRLAGFDECNDGAGLIADFSAARTRSFELAREPWVLWADSDDTVRGLERLPALLEKLSHLSAPVARCPYEYAIETATGECATIQARERIVRNDGAFHWVRPVHEGLVSVEGRVDMVHAPEIVWTHRRGSVLAEEKGRNLRILRAYAEACGLEDAWTLYSLGLECAAAGEYAEAAGYLTKYLTFSGWDHERVMAALRLADCHVALDPLGRQDAAMEWVAYAQRIKPDWFECKFAEAKVRLLRGTVSMRKDARSDEMRRAIAAAKAALETRPTETDLATYPLDRTRYVYEVIRGAHDVLDDTDAAIADTDEQLARTPEHPGLRFALQEYEERRRARLGLRSHHAGKLDIVFACGYSPEAWDASTPNGRGIGGSETAVVELARRLAALGARVRVFNLCPQEGLYDGVEYRKLHGLAKVTDCDVLIAWRDASMLEHTPAKVKWLWVHDVYPFKGTPWNRHIADRILAVSEWHAQTLRDSFPDSADKVTATRNGIEPKRFAIDVKRNSHKAVYTSSPDRGLNELLDMWPRIRAQVPDAELHIFYGSFGPWLELQSRMSSMAPLGVHARGRVNQAQLALEMKSAGVWLYPSWLKDRPFLETSCIGALEAQAAGMRIVAGDFAALHENVIGHALIPGDAKTAEFQDAFVARACEALTASEESGQSREAQGWLAANAYDWQPVAEQWLSLAQQDVARPRVTSAHVARVDARHVLHMFLSYIGTSSIVMDPRNPGNEAMGGGSRVGFINLVEAMAKRGTYRIRAFSTWKDRHFERGGVEYCAIDRAAAYPPPDAAFAFFDTTLLNAMPAGVLRVASHHTYEPYPKDDWQYVDVHTAPTQPPIDYMRETLEYAPNATWRVLPNGVPERPIVRKPVPGRVIYHTSWDRGLHRLFEAWPQIRARLPNATLHVVGPVRAVADSTEKLTGATERLFRAIRESLPGAEAAGGLTLLGRLPRAELDRELSEAAVFAFPAEVIVPCETFSLSLMECCKAGIPIVLAPVDALESLYRGSVRMVRSPIAMHLAEFVDAVVDVLTDSEQAEELSRRGKLLAANYTFDRQAEMLDTIIQTHLPASAAKALSAE